MATFKISIQKHHLRSDGFYPVSIRVCWQQKYGYIRTQYYVTRDQLTRNFELRDNEIIRDINNRIIRYQEMKKKLEDRIYQYSARELAEYFAARDEVKANPQLDLLAYSAQKIAGTKNKGTAGIYQTVVNSLVKYLGVEVPLYTTDISVKFLKDYQVHLEGAGLTPTGINLYLRTLRALFYAMRDEYNDEDRGDIRIPHNPFRKFTIPSPGIADKINLKVDQVKLIRDYLPKRTSRGRDILARDVFMLSFYLVGMNTVDLYHLPRMTNARVTYKRAKTRSRRQDEALISVLVEPEAADIIQRYRDPAGKRMFNFYQRYSNAAEFNHAVNKGLKIIGKAEEVDIPGLDFYAARRSWATIARNVCNIDKYDIHEALNHSDPGMKVTDIYIKKDWSVIDRANRRVLDVLKENSPV